MFSLRLIVAPRGLPPVVVFGIATLIVPPAAAQCRYTAITFEGPADPVFGTPTTFATGLNNHDQVVGYYFFFDSGSARGFVWSEEIGMTVLPAVPGGVRPRAINDAGLIVGSMGSSPGRAFLWDGSQYVDLGIPAGGTHSEALAISEDGVVVGTWGNGVTGNPGEEGFVWQNGVMTRLGPTLGQPESGANDINSHGAITGSMGVLNYADYRAYVLDGAGGGLLTLPPAPGCVTSEGIAINDLGDVCGGGLTGHPSQPGFRKCGFAWIDGQMIDLGGLPGFRDTMPKAIGVDGIVVGFAESHTQRAFVWQRGALADLETLVDSLQPIRSIAPKGINNSGKIVASSTRGGTLLTPILVPGDIDFDCAVDLSDLLLVLANYGCSEACDEDADGDGAVDLTDVAIVLANLDF